MTQKCKGRKRIAWMRLVDDMLPSLCGEDGITRVGVPLIGGVAGEVEHSYN